MISVGYLMPSLYLMTRLQSVEGNQRQVLTLSPFYSLMSSFDKCEQSTVGPRRLLGFDMTTNSVHSAYQDGFTKTLFVLCLLADLWRQGAAAFRACPSLTVTWRSWTETPCAYLDSGRWRPWSGAGEFRPLVPSL